MQEAVGLQSATDGELRRGSWHMDFIYQLGGVRKLASDLVVEFHNPAGSDRLHAAIACASTSRCGSTTRSSADDFAFLRDTVTTAVPKLTIPSPSMVHYRGGRAAIDETVYPDLDAFWADLTAAYREEIAGSASWAARYLQLDDTSLAYLNDPKQREHDRASIGGDPEHQHEATSATSTRRSPSRPRGHVRSRRTCAAATSARRGIASGDYEYVAEVLLNELEVDGFFMEWDDERSGGFEPLRFLPPGKLVVLGLVTTKSGELERRTSSSAASRRPQVRRHRPALPLAAVRLLVDGRRQRPDASSSRPRS